MKKENALQKEIRLLGFTQNELANKLGISKQRVSLWCTGKALISADMVKKLKALGVTKKTLAYPMKEV